MLKSDLLYLISQGEGSKLEFKRDDVRAESLAKEIVAFANMNGGQILVGVEDDGTTSGVLRENFQTWLMDTVVGEYVFPFVLPDYEEVDSDSEGGDQVKVGVITIPMGTAKPYTLNHNKREDVYVRYGDTCQLASREQQARLFESGGFFSIEKMPIHGSTLENLDSQRYQQYFTDILGETISQAEWQNFLINRYLLIETDAGECCSYLACLLFGKNPQRLLPQSGIRLTVYPSNEKDYSTDFDEHLNSPFVELRNVEDNKPIEMALHDRIIDRLQPFICKENLQGSTRTRHMDYPPDAIREVLINALVHRDWTKQNYVRVEAYPNRLEISSPGALPNGMTIEKIKYGEQAQRNPASVRIFRDYGYREERGIGIRRKVIPLMLQHNQNEPEFEATEEHFKVTLWKKNQTP